MAMVASRTLEMYISLSVLILMLLAFAGGCGEDRGPSWIEWMADIDAALETAKEEGKPIMVDFMATWCPPCHAMEDSTFSAPAVIRKAAAFIPVRIDVDEQREVAIAYNGNARKYGGVGIPNILFMDSKGGKLKHIVGYYGPDGFIVVMDSVLAMLDQ
jgi:thiol:disulfide interchange protein